MAQLYTFVTQAMKERLHAVAAENDRTIHKTIERAVRENVDTVPIMISPSLPDIKIFTRADDDLIARVKARAKAETRNEWEVVHSCIAESL